MINISDIYYARSSKCARCSEERCRKLHDKLLILTEETTDNEIGYADETSWIFQNYDLSTKSGQEFYRWLTEQQLLEFLKKLAIELNHSPSQKEVLWVWRMYIKKRFKRWPYALDAAGLNRSAGISGKSLDKVNADKKEYEVLLKELRDMAITLCRIPHPKDVPQLCQKIKKHKKNWNEVIIDAGLDSAFFGNRSVNKIEDLEEKYLKELENIKILAEQLGRAPLKSEVDKEVRESLNKRCGGWRNTLFQIDLEPVVKIAPFSATSLLDNANNGNQNHKERLSDCYYMLLHPDDQTKKDLMELKKIADEKKCVPNKKEVLPELRKRLQDSCGSWSNALFQLGLENKKK